MEKLAKEFEAELFNAAKRAKKEVNYPGTIFVRMLSERGGVSTAKYLINTPKPSAGYTALWELGRLDLAVEAIVIENPKWHPLFEPEDLQRAGKRLLDYGYTPRIRA